MNGFIIQLYDYKDDTDLLLVSTSLTFGCFGAVYAELLQRFRPVTRYLPHTPQRRDYIKFVTHFKSLGLLFHISPHRVELRLSRLSRPAVSRFQVVTREAWHVQIPDIECEPRTGSKY